MFIFSKIYHTARRDHGRLLLGKRTIHRRHERSLRDVHQPTAKQAGRADSKVCRLEAQGWQQGGYRGGNGEDSRQDHGDIPVSAFTTILIRHIVLHKQKVHAPKLYSKPRVA